MKRFHIAALFLLACAAGVRAQGGDDELVDPDLAPTCAGCAGEARVVTAGGLVYPWTLNQRWLDIGQRNARARMTLDRVITNRLSLGIEWNPTTGEVQPRATWFATPEKAGLPSVVLGAAADRLSTARGHAVFLTFARSFSDGAFKPFVSAKYSPSMGTMAVPFGANLRLEKATTLQALYDGDYTHLLLSRREGRMNASLVLARMKHLGFQVSTDFR